MRVHVVSMVCKRNGHIHHRAQMVYGAQSDGEAERLALKEILAERPTSEGWVDHSASATDVTEEVCGQQVTASGLLKGL